ncbi:MAG TPA: threonyl-tRNA synthetase editing domain-containing protein, partial [Anaerolineae bacterium]|nr:threonyl-tRNA synthetase editing domain-containing protein [Anaerolineae bacterium]
EAEDEAKPGLETKVVKNIKWLANKRSLKNIVLHSFTHLSGSTASPEFAQTLLNNLEQRLHSTGYQVWQTPFGYFCEWDLSVYGDSLAKVFKEI